MAMYSDGGRISLYLVDDIPMFQDGREIVQSMKWMERYTGASVQLGTSDTTSYFSPFDGELVVGLARQCFTPWEHVFALAHELGHRDAFMGMRAHEVKEINAAYRVFEKDFKYVVCPFLPAPELVLWNERTAWIRGARILRESGVEYNRQDFMKSVREAYGSYNGAMFDALP